MGAFATSDSDGFPPSCVNITTALQNDFSYYRRNYPKMSQLEGVHIGEAEAGLISMFLAQVGAPGKPAASALLCP
jgi:hypothetical protein